MGIRSKLLLLSITATILLFSVSIACGIYAFAAFVDAQADKRIADIARYVKNDLAALEGIALEQARAFAFRAELAAACKAALPAFKSYQTAKTANDTETLKIRTEALKPLQDALLKIYKDYDTFKKADFFTVTDAEGNVILRSANPAKFGDNLSDTPSMQYVIAKHHAVCYFESTAANPITVRAAAPVFDPDDGHTLIGTLSCGFGLDRDKTEEDWIKHVQNTYQVETTTFVGKRRAATSLIDPATGEKAVGTELKNAGIEAALFDRQEEYTGTAAVLGRAMRVHYQPLVNRTANKTIGAIFIGLPVEEERAIVRQTMVSNIVITVIGLLIFSAVLWVMVSKITGPIRQMTVAAKALSSGALEIRLDVRTKDELQILAEAFNSVATELKAKTDVAVQIANGDLTTWVPLASPHDTLGIAFIEMRYAFYDSLKDLTSLARAISNEGDQLTVMNERLVANSVESSSQLRDVSQSIDGLNTQTKMNADESRNAEKFVVQATDGSAAGQQKMQKMTDAMTEITKSSQEIKNIIRVIDDIAFQTNLLALNAAVEAARAGAHGKGFAVVAEEVRNLAARSAKAAQETAALIEESIRQVETGSTVATETSAALNAIMLQVQQVSSIVSKISHESDTQAQRLNEVNLSVSQVAQTAEQNSQTVSDSAAAVAQLSVMAQKLDTITKHFHTNDAGKVTKPPRDAGFLPERAVHRIAETT
ncbi:MAG: methyl-accepting chemotaxis protein [Planctomycetaceae bacterium]|jgi:methyl-accepting chemotaxis protein|nr:methyl-accepting chemotaxis protein [Planctomycetaceae bacterium]